MYNAYKYATSGGMILAWGRIIIMDIYVFENDTGMEWRKKERKT
jgi:hypothetical protein